MKFTTSCFVRVEDVDKRKKLVEWLEGQIGYRYCVGCYNARSAIDSPLIPMCWFRPEQKRNLSNVLCNVLTKG